MLSERYCDGLRAHAGVAILVHDSIHSQEIALQSTLSVVAVKVTMTHISFIVCSLYLPPGQPLSATALFDLFSEIPTPFIAVGDINAHNSLWGSSRTYQRGALLEQLLANNLVLSNAGEPRHICMATGSTTSIDLALCSRSIVTHLDWTVLSDLHGSANFQSFIFACLDLLWNIPHIGFSVGQIGSDFGHPHFSLMHLSWMSVLWHNISPMPF